MDTARTPPPVDLSMLLNQAGYALSNRLAAALAELDVSVRVYCVLAKAAEGEHTQGRLAELAWMDKTTMVVTLDEMERRGLAERRLSPEDRRVRVVAITAAGRRLLAEADAIVQRVYDDVLGGVDGDRRATFLAVLGGLVDGPLAAPFHMEARTRRRAQRTA
jgi:MarR family transcriptional regulator, transcriptional regulator for hemolysin